VGTHPSVELETRDIIFFDSHCSLCSRIVQWLTGIDKNQMIYFTSLNANLENFNIPGIRELNTYDTMLYYHAGQLYEKSDAVIAILKSLGSPWSFFHFVSYIPKSVRDLFYDLVAKNRYYWFGSKKECEVHSWDIKNRFLN
jgi:predicted DCC family thiol-disulfide oxidoreductase YuxK